MTAWYATREATKRAVPITGLAWDAVIDAELDAATREIETLLRRRFIPLLATRQYRWPQRASGRGYELLLDDDLLSVSALTTDDETVTAISSSDYFLEPQTLGPPYHRLEIDQSSSAFLSFKATPQRAVRVTGLWSYSQDTRAAGALAAAISDTSGTTITVTDASLVGVGDALLIDSEQLHVSAKAAATTGTTLSGNPTASQSDQSIAVASGAAVKAGEVILIDSERMLVISISSNTLTVQRAYDGTTLAAHTASTTVYAFRSLTVERGGNSTTAATHSNGASIRRYVAPADIQRFCRALAIQTFTLNQSGWSGVVGSGEQSIELRGTLLAQERGRIRARYQRRSFGSV